MLHFAAIAGEFAPWRAPIQRLIGRAIHQAQKVLGMLPILLASHRIVAIGRLREVAIMIKFVLPLTSKIGFALLTSLR
jgi:hypothetical protein